LEAGYIDLESGSMFFTLFHGKGKAKTGGLVVQFGGGPGATSWDYALIGESRSKPTTCLWMYLPLPQWDPPFPCSAHRSSFHAPRRSLDRVFLGFTCYLSTETRGCTVSIAGRKEWNPRTFPVPLDRSRKLALARLPHRRRMVV